MTKSAMIRYKIEKRYHIGKIIYAAKILTNENWKNLSIHKSKSAAGVLCNGCGNT